MLTCLALVLAVGAAELPSLAAEVEAEARSLTAQTEITPAFLAGIEDFSVDAESLSASLRQLGVEQDLPCIFHGIAEDARVRATELQSLRGRERGEQGIEPHGGPLGIERPEDPTSQRRHRCVAFSHQYAPRGKLHQNFS